jgi:hypothetical protein
VRNVIGKTSRCRVAMGFDAEVVAQALDECLADPGRTDGRQRIKHLDVSVIAEKIIEQYVNVL